MGKINFPNWYVAWSLKSPNVYQVIFHIAHFVLQFFFTILSEFTPHNIFYFPSFWLSDINDIDDLYIDLIIKRVNTFCSCMQWTNLIWLKMWLILFMQYKFEIGGRIPRGQQVNRFLAVFRQEIMAVSCQVWINFCNMVPKHCCRISPRVNQLQITTIPIVVTDNF